MVSPRQISRFGVAAFVWCWWCAPAGAQNLPPVLTQPAEVWWGAYRHNDQLVDAGASQWTFVRENMDGYLLHGAYWNQPEVWRSIAQFVGTHAKISGEQV